MPAPRIVVVSDKATTVQVEEALNAPEVRQYPRLVLLVLATQQQTDRAREEEEARAWAEHSVGKFGRFEEESGHYGALAGLQSVQQREKGLLLIHFFFSAGREARVHAGRARGGEFL